MTDLKVPFIDGSVIWYDMLFRSDYGHSDEYDQYGEVYYLREEDVDE